MNYDQEKYQDNSEITRLRLELDHVKMQRDAYASALRKEILATISEAVRDEISRHLSNRS